MESINITIYDAGNGRPLRKLEVFSQREVAMNTRDGEGWVLGSFTDATHYVADGEPVEIPACPHACGSFDFDEKAWINTEAESLADLRESARHDVNAWAARERSALITITPGQSEVYAMKRAEAEAFLANEDPNPADYPLIFGEIGLTGGNAFEVAQVILNISDISKTGIVEIEARRLSMIATIQSAGIEDIENLRSSIAM